MKKSILHKYKLLFLSILFFLFFIPVKNINAQFLCDTCDNTLTFYVDLSSTPDSAWSSVEVKRNGVCCDNAGENCIRFIVTTHPKTDQLSFNLISPPIPPGQFYQYNCGPLVSVGEPLCISGTGPHCIVYCKPGGDKSAYGITASKSVESSPDKVVRDGCIDTIIATGFDESSMVWQTVAPGADGDYNSYLSCLAGCDTVYVTPGAGYPPYIDVEVSGVPLSPCADPVAITDTTRVYFVSTLGVDIQPDAPAVCFGAANAVLTANGTGGTFPVYNYLWSTGETTQSITVGSGNYTVTLTDTTDCGSEVDNVTVTQHPAPITANAGLDQAKCTTSPATTLNGVVTVATGGIWSGGAGAYAPDATTLNAVYTPTAGEIVTGFVTLTLTTTGDGGCPGAVDNMTITFAPEPLVTAGPDQTICVSGSIGLNGSVLNATGGIWTSNGTGIFSPDNLSLNATYIPSALDDASGSVTLTLTSTGGCTDIPDDLILTISPIPIVNAGTDQAICQGDNVILNGTVTNGASAGIWSTTGDGTFAPSNTTLNAIYTLGPNDIIAGTFLLTLASTDGCTVITDNITITIQGDPTVDAGADQTICDINNVSLLGIVANATGGTWITSGTGSFSPANNLLNTLYTPSLADKTAGSVTLTLTTTGGCFAVSDNLVVTILPVPIVNAGADQTICEGDNVSLNSTVSNGATAGIWTTSGTGVFLPSNTSLTATYQPSVADVTAGTVVLTLTSTDGCTPIADNVIITIQPIPVVDAGADKIVCANDRIVVLSGSVTNGATQGIWSSSGSGTFTPSDTDLNAIYTPSDADTTAGSVILTLTSTDGCTAISNNLTVTMLPAPYVNAGTDQFVCEDDLDVNLSGVVSGATSTGAWSTMGGGTFSPSNTVLNGLYNISASGIIAGSVQLVLSSTNNGSCNPVTDTMNVDIINLPVVDAGSDTTICNFANIQLNATITGGSGEGLWTTTNGTGTFIPDHETLNAIYQPSAADIASGSVTLLLTSTNNGSCQPDDDLMVISILPEPTVFAGADQTVCANNAFVTLDGQITNGATQGIWTTSGTGTFLPNSTTLTAVYAASSTDTTAGSIVLTLTSTDGCVNKSNDLTVNFSPAPYVSAGADIYICEGEVTAVLNGVISGITTTGFWTTLGSGTFTPANTILNATYNLSTPDTTAGSVSIILTSTNNGDCSPASDTVDVIITTTPISVDAGTDQSICNNMVASLTGFIDGGSGKGQWSTSGTGTFSPTDTSLNAIYTPSAADITAGSVIITLTTIQTCVTGSDDMILTITPGPLTNAGADQITCANNPNINLNGVVSGTTITGIWSTLGSGSFLPNNTTLNATYQLSAADITAGSVSLVLTSTNNGACDPDRDTMLISIISEPTVNPGPDQTICANGTATLSGTITGGVGTGIWSTSGTGAFNPSDTLLNVVYTPSTADAIAGTVTITLTSTNSAPCLPESETLTLTIQAGPQANAGADQLVCKNNANVSLSGSVVTATGGIWSTLGTGNFVPTNTDLNATYAPSMTDIMADSVKLVLTTTGNGLCPSSTDTMTIEFYPAAVVNAGPDKFICRGTMNASISGSVSGITTTGQWSTLGSGTFVPNNTSLNVSYNLSTADSAAGSITLVLTSTSNGNCLPVTDTVLVFITDIPSVSAGGDQTVCANNANVSLNGIVTGSPGTGVWSAPNGTGTFSPSDTSLATIYTPSLADTTQGFVTIILTSTNTCVPVRDTMEVTITPAPYVEAGPDILVCENVASVPLSGNVHGGTNTGVWSTPDGAGSFSPTNTNLNASYVPSAADLTAGTILIVLTSTNNGNCITEDDTLRINFGISPVADYNFTSPACVGQNVNFTDASTVTSGSITSWEWDFAGGNTSSAQDTTYTFTSSGIYDVQLVVTSDIGCTDTIVKQADIKGLPVVDFSSTPNCARDSVFFTDLSPNSATWLWVFGNGNSSTDQVPEGQIYDLPGSYNVLLSITDNNTCENSIQKPVTIFDSPDAEILANNVCLGELALFTDASTSVDPITSWLWDFGDTNTSTDQNPTHTYTSAGSYNVILTASSDYCSNTDTLQITVEPNPVISVTPTQISGCNPLTVNFDNTTVGATTYNWTFDDGAISNLEDPSHIYMNTSNTTDITYTTRLIAESGFGCTDTLDIPVTVNHLPGAFFNLTTEPGCSPLTTVFTNSSVGADKYIWNFNNEVATDTTYTQSDTSYIFANTNSFYIYPEITLTAITNEGCIDSTKLFTAVFPSPTNSFTPQPDTACHYELVQFTAEAGASTYWWDFGDGETGYFNNSPSHVYTNTSTTGEDSIYTVKLVTKEGECHSDTITNQIVIHPLPPVNFTPTPLLGCAPLEAVITNKSTGLFTWSFGDGTPNSNTTDVTFNHPYDNTSINIANYDLTLTVEDTNQCKNSLTQTLKVFPRVTADFTRSDTIGCSPFTVDFTNHSSIPQGTRTYYWDFGDGNYATTTHPTNTFPKNTGSTNKKYTVQLIATDSTGQFVCSDIVEKDVYVRPSPEALFALDETSGCSPLKVNVTNASSGVTNYIWDFGDDSISYTSAATFEHSYTNYEVDSVVKYEFKLSVKNAFGCWDSVIQTVDVFPSIEAVFTPDTNEGCTPLTVIYTENIDPAQVFSYEWKYGDNTSGTGPGPKERTYINGDTSDIIYNAKLIITSIFTCRDTQSVNITVHPAPTAEVTIKDVSGCAPFDAQIENASAGVDSYHWDFGDGETLDTAQSASSFIHQYGNETSFPKTYIISLDVENTFGCDASDSDTILIYPQVKAEIVLPDTAGCSPFEFSFTNADNNNVSLWDWEFKDGGTSNAPTGINQYINDTQTDQVYDIFLKVRSSDGCADSVPQKVLVYAAPVAQFGPTPLSQQYPNATVVVNDLTEGTWPYYSWHFGEENSDTLKGQDPAPYTYNRWGEYEITLAVASNHCSDTTTNLIIILEPDLVAILHPEDTTSCPPAYMTFVNQTLNYTSVRWEISDGTKYYDEDTITHPFLNPGIHEITLIVTGEAGGEDIDQFNVIVYHAATADFKVSSQSIEIPNEPALFFNTSSHDDTYMWYFGDGETDTIANPIHTYNLKGSYDVALVVYSEYGCKDSIMKPQYITAEPICDLKFANAFTPDPSGPSGGRYTRDDTKNDIYHPIHVGIDEYRLEIFNRWGELVFVSEDVTIGWDGYYKGELSKQDVYVWKCTYTCEGEESGKPYIKVGDVTLLR